MRAVERVGWHQEDRVAEASADSFPASDAPSWTPTVGSVSASDPPCTAQREVISESRGGDDQPQLVPAGDYAIKLKYGDHKAQTKLTVEALPGVHEGEFVAP